MRWETSPLSGGRGSPWLEDPPSILAALCTLIVKKRAPEVVCHAATRGLRLESHAAFVGSMRPGLKLPESLSIMKKCPGRASLTSV